MNEWWGKTIVDGAFCGFKPSSGSIQSWAITEMNTVFRLRLLNLSKLSQSQRYCHSCTMGSEGSRVYVPLRTPGTQSLEICCHCCTTYDLSSQKQIATAVDTCHCLFFTAFAWMWFFPYVPHCLHLIKLQSTGPASLWILWGAEGETSHRHWERTGLRWGGLECPKITAPCGEEMSWWWKQAVLEMFSPASCVTDEGESHNLHFGPLLSHVWRKDINSGGTGLSNHSTSLKVYKAKMQSCKVYNKVYYL